MKHYTKFKIYQHKNWFQDQPALSLCVCVYTNLLKCSRILSSRTGSGKLPTQRCRVSRTILRWLLHGCEGCMGELPGDCISGVAHTQKHTPSHRRTHKHTDTWSTHWVWDTAMGEIERERDEIEWEWSTTRSIVLFLVSLVDLATKLVCENQGVCMKFRGTLFNACFWTGWLLLGR